MSTIWIGFDLPDLALENFKGRVGYGFGDAPPILDDTDSLYLNRPTERISDEIAFVLTPSIGLCVGRLLVSNSEEAAEAELERFVDLLRIQTCAGFSTPHDVCGDDDYSDERWGNEIRRAPSGSWHASASISNDDLKELRKRWLSWRDSEARPEAAIAHFCDGLYTNSRAVTVARMIQSLEAVATKQDEKKKRALTSRRIPKLIGSTDAGCELGDLIDSLYQLRNAKAHTDDPIALDALLKEVAEENGFSDDELAIAMLGYAQRAIFALHYRLASGQRADDVRKWLD